MNRLYIESQPYTIFKSDITAHCFEERCIPFANDGDIVITSYSIDNNYIKYLDSLGLNISRNVDFLVPSFQDKDLASSIIKDAELLKYIYEKTSTGKWIIETYLYDEEIKKISEILALPLSQEIEIFKKYGAKSDFRELAHKLGLPLPNGIIVNGYNADQINSFVEMYPEAVIKKNNTLGGMGVFFIQPNESSIRKIVVNDDIYVVEEKIVPNIEGSIQIFFHGGDYDIFIDECIIERKQFKGFIYPFDYEKQKINEYAKKTVYFLQQNKINYGYFGLDFMISGDNIYFHDFNPRKTGVTYIMLFLCKLFGKERIKKSAIVYEHIQLPTCKQWNLNNLLIKLNPLLFGYGIKDEGLFLFNCSSLKYNMLHLVSLSFCGKEKEYIQKAKLVLNSPNSVLESFRKTENIC